MANFIKKLMGGSKDSQKGDCCGVEIIQVDDKKDIKSSDSSNGTTEKGSSCCGSSSNSDSCCS